MQKLTSHSILVMMPPVDYTANNSIQEGRGTLFNSRIALLLIKISISLGLLMYLFWKIDLSQFAKTLHAIQIFPFLTAGILYIGCQYLSSYRWQVLLRAHGIYVPVNRLFSFYLVGMFFNNFLPTSIGGDVVKGYDLYRHSGRGKEAITTVLLERYTGLVALIIIGLAALLVGYQYFPDPVTAILLSGIAAGFICGTLVVISRYSRTLCLRTTRRFNLKRLSRIIYKIYRPFERYKTHKWIFLYSIIISFGIQVLNILVYILVADALNISISGGYFFLFFPVITIISMLPLSINGLGIRDGLMVYLFSKIEVPMNHALSLSLSWFFVVTCISLLGGLIFIVRKDSLS